MESLLRRFQPFFNALEFKQVTKSDNSELDEITAADPWNIPKSASIEMLGDGWLCFAAKHRGHVAASSWVKCGPVFYEPYLKRSIRTDDDGAYTWRTVCVREFRGRGVVPWLGERIMRHLSENNRARTFWGFVRPENIAQRRSLVQSGWVQTGRIGFFEINGVRLHYIWGRETLPFEKRRLFVQHPRH